MFESTVSIKTSLQGKATLPRTNSSHLKRAGTPKGKVVFQPSHFQVLYMSVYQSASNIPKIPPPNHGRLPQNQVQIFQPFWGFKKFPQFWIHFRERYFLVGDIPKNPQGQKSFLVGSDHRSFFFSFSGRWNLKKKKGGAINLENAWTFFSGKIGCCQYDFTVCIYIYVCLCSSIFWKTWQFILMYFTNLDFPQGLSPILIYNHKKHVTACDVAMLHCESIA